MQIIYLLISLSLILALGFLMAFIWAIKSGQQNDLITPGMRILMDEPISSNSDKNQKSSL